MHVRYALVAEFDLGKGAEVKSYYPNDVEPLFNNTFAQLQIPDGVHARTEDWTFFPLWEEGPEAKLGFVPASSASQKLYVCDYVRSVFGVDLERGARIRAIAVVTSEPTFACLKPLLMAVMNHYGNSENTAGIAQTLYDCVRRLDTSKVPKLTWYEKRLLDTKIRLQMSQAVPRSDANEGDSHFVSLETKIDGVDKPVQIHVPTYPDNYSAGNFSITRLARLCLHDWKCHGSDKEVMPYGRDTPPYIVLWLAAMTGKRVLVYADATKTTCSRLCDIVFACSYLSSAEGLLDAYTRVFPCLDLSRIEDLQKLRDNGGFIAGTTNAAFLIHPEWYDVLLRLDNGHIQVSSPTQVSKIPPMIPQDVEFAKTLASFLDNVPQETKLRELFCIRFEEILRNARVGHGALMTCDLKAFGAVYGVPSEKWRDLPSYQTYLQRVGPESLLQDQMFRLSSGRTDAPDLYKDLQSEVVDLEDVTRLLLIPEAVYYISLGLFHRNSIARAAAFDLMHRIKKHHAGARFCATLPPIHRRGYDILEIMNTTEVTQ